MKTCIRNLITVPPLVPVLCLMLSGQVSAQTFTVLHTFRLNGDGAGPFAGLVLSGDTLYGTTVIPHIGGGTIFSVNAEGTLFTNLHNFGGDGNTPVASIVLSGNTLYGTTRGEGWPEWADNYGTVFKVNTDGTGFTNLYVFTATLPSIWGTNADGAYPQASLILSAGTLYGVASAGGRFGNGTVFAMGTDGTGFTNLHDFIGGPDGAGPMGGLILSGSTLYGTTLGAAAGQGTVFKLQVDGGQFSTLHSFPSGGSTAALVLSGDTLYGTTYDDGDSDNGSVFSLKTNGSGFKTLHNFTSFSQDFVTNPDGGYPQSRLVLSGTTLYGTADDGGPFGSGVVFALNIDGTGFTNLHSFTATSINPAGISLLNYTNSDGAYPRGEIILSANTLYGTTVQGGAGMGTVFSISFAPQLTMNSSGWNVILSWPTNYAGFDYSGYHLQSATDLNSPVWTTNLPAPDVINGRYTVTNPVSGTQQFFRLSQ